MEWRFEPISKAVWYESKPHVMPTLLHSDIDMLLNGIDDDDEFEFNRAS